MNLKVTSQFQLHLFHLLSSVLWNLQYIVNNLSINNWRWSVLKDGFDKCFQ